MAQIIDIARFFGLAPARKPPGFAEGGSPIDPPEPPFGETLVDVGDLRGARLGLVYRDGLGGVSRRIVSVASVSQSSRDTFYLDGHCELRNAHRTFRIDRILEIVDFRTGEVIDDPERFLLPLIVVARARRGGRSGRRGSARLIAESADGLIVLLFFARANNRISAAEKVIIWAYLDWQRERCGIEGRIVRKLIEAFIRATVPDEGVFGEALARLLDSEQAHARYILARVPEIIAADGRIADEERRRAKVLIEVVESVRPGLMPTG